MRDAFIARLTRLAEQDPRIILLTGDLGFGVLTHFSTDRPRQYLNVGVAEQNMTGLAVGLALDGRIAFTYSIGNFPTLRCLEQLRNDAAYHDANVKVVAIGGGFSYGQLGMSHHATEDLAILRAIPGVTVVAPGCLWEAEEATSALAATPGTAYLRLDKSSAGRTAKPGERFVLGQVRALAEGDELTFVVCGGILGLVLEATAALAAQGIRARVLSAHSLRPFDSETILRAARETGGIITVEEHMVDGGLGGLVAETLLEGGVAPRAFHRMGIRERFCATVGTQDYLRARVGLDLQSLVSAGRDLARGRFQVVGQETSPLR